MPELHDLLERRASGYEPASDLFDRVLARRHRRERIRRTGSAVVALLVAGIVIGGLLRAIPGGGVSDRAPASVPPAIPSSTEPVALEAGTYVISSSRSSVADFTATFPEGWMVQYGDTFSKHPDSEEGVGFYSTFVDTIFADACEGSDGDLVEVGPSVDDLAAALRHQPGAETSGPVETTVAGFAATRIDLTVPKGFVLKNCSLPDALQIWMSPPDAYTVLFPDGVASAYIVDVDGQRQVFWTWTASAASDEDQQELQGVLDSIQIET
jgi:hypothetical protein